MFHRKSNTNNHVGYFNIQHGKASRKDSTTFFALLHKNNFATNLEFILQRVPVYPSTHAQVYELSASVHEYVEYHCFAPQLHETFTQQK